MHTIYTLQANWQDFRTSVKRLKKIWSLSKWLLNLILFLSSISVCVGICFGIAKSSLHIHLQAVIVIMVGILFSLALRDFVLSNRRQMQAKLYSFLSIGAQREAYKIIASIQTYFNHVSDEEILIIQGIRLTMVDINNSSYYEHNTHLLNWTQFKLMRQYCEKKTESLVEDQKKN